MRRELLWWEWSCRYFWSCNKHLNLMNHFCDDKYVQFPSYTNKGYWCNFTSCRRKCRFYMINCSSVRVKDSTWMSSQSFPFLDLLHSMMVKFCNCSCSWTMGEPSAQTTDQQRSLKALVFKYPELHSHRVTHHIRSFLLFLCW